MKKKSLSLSWSRVNALHSRNQAQRSSAYFGMATGGVPDTNQQQQQQEHEKEGSSDEEGESFRALPWWKRIVLDPSFRRSISSITTRKIKAFEDSCAKLQKETYSEYEPPRGSVSSSAGIPVRSVVIPPNVWDPQATSNRVFGDGLTYRWVNAFPPTGYIHLPGKKPAVTGAALTYNIMSNNEAGAASQPVERPGTTVVYGLAIPSQMSFNELAKGAGARFVSEVKEGDSKLQFLGTLRCSRRLQRWKILCSALHLHCREMPRDIPHDFLQGIPSFLDPDMKSLKAEATFDSLDGYNRSDLSESRMEYLFNSNTCKDIMKKLFGMVERDIHGRVTKEGFVEFVLDLLHLYFPSFSSQSNIAVAEDEWVCRGTKEKPDFSAFMRFFFDFPLLLCRSEFMTEELYSSVWEFTIHCLEEKNLRNTDDYLRHLMAKELIHDSDIMRHPARCRPLLIFRKSQQRERERQAAQQQKEAKMKTLSLSTQEAPLLSLTVPFLAPRASVDRISQASKKDEPAITEEHEQQNDTLAQSFQMMRMKQKTKKVAPPKPAPKQQAKTVTVGTTKSSSYTLYEEVYALPQLERDDIDEILDYCSDVSDGDFENERESIRTRYEIAQQMRKDREVKIAMQRSSLAGAGLDHGLASSKNRKSKAASFRVFKGAQEVFMEQTFETIEEIAGSLRHRFEERHEEEEEEEDEYDDVEEKNEKTGFRTQKMAEVRQKERLKIQTLASQRTEKKEYNMFAHKAEMIRATLAKMNPHSAKLQQRKEAGKDDAEAEHLEVYKPHPPPKEVPDEFSSVTKKEEQQKEATKIKRPLSGDSAFSTHACVVVSPFLAHNAGIARLSTPPREWPSQMQIAERPSTTPANALRPHTMDDDQSFGKIETLERNVTSASGNRAGPTSHNISLKASSLAELLDVRKGCATHQLRQRVSKKRNVEELAGERIERRKELRLPDPPSSRKSHTNSPHPTLVLVKMLQAGEHRTAENTLGTGPEPAADVGTLTVQDSPRVGGESVSWRQSRKKERQARHNNMQGILLSGRHYQDL